MYFVLFLQTRSCLWEFFSKPLFARLSETKERSTQGTFELFFRFVVVFFFKFQFLHGEHSRWCTVAHQAINPKEPMTPEESSVFNLFARLKYSFYNVKNGVLNQRVMIETLTVHFQCRGVEKILKFKVEPCKES